MILEMTSGEFAAGPRFEISLKGGGFLPRTEGDSSFELPWTVFSRVGTTALVVFSQASRKIVG